MEGKCLHQIITVRNTIKDFKSWHAYVRYYIQKTDEAVSVSGPREKLTNELLNFLIDTTKTLSVN